MKNDDDITYMDEKQIAAILKKNNNELSPSNNRNLVAYPEECCDAAEISDDEYTHWMHRYENGFWRTFLQEKRKCRK